MAIAAGAMPARGGTERRLMEPRIRPARAGEDAAIGGLLELAFGGRAERRLVERLRAEGNLGLVLVAVDEAQTLLGVIAFPPLALEGEGATPSAVALAPLAVLPAMQRRGIGSRLVRAGLAACREAGAGLAIVVGDPAYYGRFGFSAEAARDLASPYAGPHFQALALRAGALGARRRVTYPAPFAALD
jgi:putative acetyltransferase